MIRRQVATLDAAGERPDVLVNLTNDAWYWGSSELDMHLACDVFRAVETRTPLVIAANGGISAWIDRHGRIRAQSPRQQPDVILADVELNRTQPADRLCPNRRLVRRLVFDVLHRSWRSSDGEPRNETSDRSRRRTRRSASPSSLVPRS